jgi:hypothetical protein
MDAAVNYPGAAFTSHAADFHAAQSVPCMDADADNVTGLNQLGLNQLQRFVGDHRVAILARSRRSKHVQPPRGDDADPKRNIAGIYQVNAHR